LPAGIALAAFAGLCTAVGGLRAVVYTDFSWTAAAASIPAENLSLIRPLDDPALPWLGVIVGRPMLGKIWTQSQGVADGLPHFTIVAGLTTTFCFVAAIAAPLITAPPAPERTQGIVFEGAGAARRERRPPNRAVSALCGR
jgi:hypothetical protein